MDPQNLVFIVQSRTFRDDPIIIGDERSQYLYASVFQSKTGDTWIFTVDRESKQAYLTGSDVDWSKHSVNGDNFPIYDLVLSDDAKTWLSVCWMAIEQYRPEVSLDVPDYVLTLPVAASLWGKSESTLKRHVNDNPPKLVAKRVGGIWLTTVEAMKRAYGQPTHRIPSNISLEEDE